MVSFHLTQQDLLIMSVAALVSIKTELIANRIVEWLVPVLSSKSSVIRTLAILQKQRPGFLAKILMEQITLWTIIVVILGALTYTSISLTPFGHQPMPYPTFLIRFILEVSVARFVVMSARILLVKDVVMSQTTTTVTPKTSGNAKLDFIYNLFSATCNLIYLGYHQNLLLGVTATFMEASSTPLECCRLIEESNKSSGSKSYRKTTILAFALCFICRLILPSLLLTLAATQESPFRMDDVPLATFFACCIFYSSFNVQLLYHSFMRMRNSFHHSHSHPFPHSNSAPISFSIHVHDSDNNDICQTKNDNYGFIHPSNSGDLYYTLKPEDSNQVSTGENEENPRRVSMRKIIKNSDRDMLGKLRFNRYAGSSLDKGRSQDSLLGSQDFLSDSDADVLMVALNSEFEKYQQPTVNESENCEDYQRSEISHIRDCMSYQQSAIDQFRQSLDMQQSEISHSNECQIYQQSESVRA